MVESADPIVRTAGSSGACSHSGGFPSERECFRGRTTARWRTRRAAADRSTRMRSSGALTSLRTTAASSGKKLPEIGVPGLFR